LRRILRLDFDFNKDEQFILNNFASLG